MTTKTTTKRAKKTTKPIDLATYTVPAGRVLMLRTCDAQMQAHGGFVWPRSGEVVAPDWKPSASCGNGLHGLLWGEGDVSMTSSASDAVWMVIECDANVVDLGQKAKTERCLVIFCGSRLEAVALIQKHAPRGIRVIYGTATAGYGGTATAGYGGTATAGYGGTATAGYGGTATAGYGGTATAGVWGTATAGDRGTATAGVWGTATAGDGGVLCVLWYDEKRSAYRRAVTEVDGEKIRPGVGYRVVEGAFVEVSR